MFLSRSSFHDHTHWTHSLADAASWSQNKPFWGQHDALSRRRPPLWNYNVSHHGTTVVLACDPHALVGVDVVQLTDRPRGNRTSQSFFRAFQDHFTVREWAFVYANEDDEDAQYRAFYTLWSLKESLIKALGIGLGFSLQRAEFVLQEHDDLWMLQLDGQLRQDWRFESTQIGATHVATVALGPLEAMHSPETSCVLPCGNLTSSALALHTAKARLEFRNNSTIGFEAVPWQCCDLLHGQRTDS